MTIHPIILCGGSGTRLWPLSRQSFPKQFVPLVGHESLLTLTLKRVSGFQQPAVCVASEAHRFMVKDCLDEANMPGKLLLEPVAKNTAAAMTLAALHMRQLWRGNELLLFCPADHHVPDILVFQKTIELGVAAAKEGAFVTFGVTPVLPSTAYGYIEQGELQNNGGRAVKRFIEKPNLEKAQSFLLSGRFLWNAGIFLVAANVLLESMAAHAPDILQACEKAMALLTSEDIGRHLFIRPNANAFDACRSESIDYAVMEKHSNVVVIPFEGQWSDVGSWSSVANLTQADDEGNRVVGQGVLIDSKRTFIHAPHKTVAALGVDDLLIVDTPDALLIAHSSQAENVKNLVAYLNSKNATETVTHRKVHRPWGWYDTVDAGERFKVKRIGVKPGASLSLQKHAFRAEHWIVVAGTAQVTRGSETYTLSENQSTYIPIGEVHRLSNLGHNFLEMIEVQSGTYLGEDDIVRLEDVYGRQDKPDTRS